VTEINCIKWFPIKALAYVAKSVAGEGVGAEPMQQEEEKELRKIKEDFGLENIETHLTCYGQE
jgi:hypothetical protein